MSVSLRIGLLVASILVFLLVIFCISKKKLNIKYSIVWFLWALLAVVMAIFPETFYKMADLLGIEMPVNAVFLIMIALNYALVLYLYMVISKHNEEMIQLTYEVAVLKKELDKLKNKNEK